MTIMVIAGGGDVGPSGYGTDRQYTVMSSSSSSASKKTTRILAHRQTVNFHHPQPTGALLPEDQLATPAPGRIPCDRPSP